MNHRVVFSIVAALLVVQPAYSDLQDWEINVNGTDYFPANGNTFGSVPGLDSSGFNSTTGLGTFTLTLSPNAAGSYYVGAWFFDPAAVPFYNEYGAVNGSAASGQSWQIDIPEYDATSANLGSGTILDNLANGTLSNTNSVTGTTTNYLDNCGANGGGPVNTSCNDLVSMALGFNFVLTADQEEVITLVLSSSNPGGFSLEDIHPVDGSNPTETDVFYSGSAVTEAVGTPPPPPPPTIPEPASWSLMVTAGGLIAFGVKRRSSRG